MTPEIKLQKLDTKGNVDIWEVDGAIVRQFESDQFTNFGHHYTFPFIPENEIWLDIEGHPDEREFFVNHALIERFLMKRGEPYNRSIEIAGEFEKEERRKTPDDAGPIRLEKTQTLPGGVEVWIVDGRKVRETHYQDFTAGGHHNVYPWVPENEIWLDNDIPPGERPFVLAHEWIERVYMGHGDDYPTAHRKASSFERALRDSPKLLAEVPALMAKLGAEKQIVKKEDKDSNTGAQLGLGAGALAASVGSYKGLRSLYKKTLAPHLWDMIETAETPIPRAETNRTLSSLLRSAGEDASQYSVHHLPEFENAAFAPGWVGKIIKKLHAVAPPEAQKMMSEQIGAQILPENPAAGWKVLSDPRNKFLIGKKYSTPSVLAHEVGHASGGIPGTIFRTAAPAIGALGQLAAPGLLAGGTAANEPDREGYYHLNAAQKAALPVSVISSLLPFAEEVRADIQAHRLAGKAGISLPGFKKSVKGALGTYGWGGVVPSILSTGLPLGALALGYHLKNRSLRKKREQEAAMAKTSSEIATRVLQKLAGRHDFGWLDPAAGTFRRPPTKQEYNQENAMFRGGMGGTLGALGAFTGGGLGYAKFRDHPILGTIGGALAGGALGGAGGYGTARLIEKIEGEPKEYWKGKDRWFEEHPGHMGEHMGAMARKYMEEHPEEFEQ